VVTNYAELKRIRELIEQQRTSDAPSRYEVEEALERAAALVVALEADVHERARTSDDLRRAMDALRAASGLSPSSWRGLGFVFAAPEPGSI
jgi:C4-dicarboxylate-specific signal transduction histidine kinase